MEAVQTLPLHGSDDAHRVDVVKFDLASKHPHCNVVGSCLMVQPALQQVSPAARVGEGVVKKRAERLKNARIRANFDFMSFLNFIM